MQEFFASLGPIDLGALILVAFNALMGLIRGFVFQFVRLGTIIGGLCLARYFAADVAAWLTASFIAIESPADKILAYFTIFFAVFLAGTVLAFLLRKVLATLHLQSFDRLLGAALGAVKGGTVVVVAVLLMSQLKSVIALQQALGESHSAHLTEQVVERVTPLFPDPVRQQFSEWLAELKEGLPPQPSGK